MNLLHGMAKTFYADGVGNPSSRKIYAFIFCSIAIVEKVKLIFFPLYHFAAIMSAAKVSDAVIITLSASMDLFAFGALAVYGWKENAGSIKPSLPVSLPTETGTTNESPKVNKKGSVKSSEEA
jgi:hypothetical protein